MTLVCDIPPPPTDLHHDLTNNTDSWIASDMNKYIRWWLNEWGNITCIHYWCRFHNGDYRYRLSHFSRMQPWAAENIWRLWCQKPVSGVGMTSHSLLWDVISYAWPRYPLRAPNLSYQNSLTRVVLAIICIVLYKLCLMCKPQISVILIFIMIRV